jgi:probable rRNA maturation factor
MNQKKTPRVIIQRRSRAAHVPSDAQFRRWAAAAADGSPGGWAITLRIVGEVAARRFNARYRAQDRATNVLSFRAELPETILASLEEASETRPLGDIVMCAPLVQSEARQQGKPVAAHWAHLVVHGVLHLLGYDHEHAGEARAMEAREAGVLAALGLPDPYA